MRHTASVEEGQRQLLLLALAKLSRERPGFDFALNELAQHFDNVGPDGRAQMFDQFRGIHAPLPPSHGCCEAARGLPDLVEELAALAAAARIDAPFCPFCGFNKSAAVRSLARDIERSLRWLHPLMSTLVNERFRRFYQDGTHAPVPGSPHERMHVDYSGGDGT